MGMAQIDELIKEFSDQVEQILVTSIINLEDGTPMAGFTSDEDLDINIPVAYFSEVARRTLSALEASDMGEFQDMVMSTDQYFVLMRVIPGGTYVHLLAITTKGNWGIAKILMKKYAEKFAEVLP